MTPDVTSVRSLPDYELLISFEDGEQRRFSVKPYLGFPAYQALTEPSRFMAAHVFNGTVCGLAISIFPRTRFTSPVSD